MWPGSSSPWALLLGPLLITVSLPSSVHAITQADIPSDTPVSKLLSLAQAALVSGSSADALLYYDTAISRDPSNYLSVFKRGATYLSLGRTSQALADFNKVLSLKPGFEGALLQRAKLRAREAQWNGAREDYLAAGKQTDGEEIAALAEAEGAAKIARDAERRREWDACVSNAGIALMTAPGSLGLRQIRAHCRLEKGGEELEALGDLQAILKINPAETQPALMSSAMYFYGLGEADKGINAVRQCLHTDPDSKSCSKMWRRQKNLNKTINKVKDLIGRRKYVDATNMLVTTGTGEDVELGLIDEVKEDVKELRQDKISHPKTPEGLITQLLEITCDAYLQMNNHKKAQPFCNDLLAMNPNALPALIHKAHAQIQADDFEGAIRTLNTARESPDGQQSRKVQDMLQEAQTLLKRSKTKDYYKVLGVDRSASTKEIKKAYRKLVAKHHPDKAATPEARPAAEKKTAAINEAYEVLSDPELRERFDRGDDPNDHESQRGHNPFQGGGGFPGGFPFQGFPGGQQFMFQQGGGGGGGGRGGGGGGRSGGQAGGNPFGGGNFHFQFQ